MADFQDKVAIITGAGSGIGSEAAVRLSGRGAMVVLSDRDARGLQETARKCAHAGGSNSKILLSPGDLTKADTITSIVQKTVNTFGGIDILINNAADLQPPKALENTSADDILLLFKNNALTAFNMTKMTMPHLVRKKGCVVNVSSLAGTHVLPSMLPYSLSKAALDKMTQSLAIEYAGQGVRINSVNAGHTRTPMFRHAGLVPNEEAETMFMERVATDIPLLRVGEPSEVVNAILFLASHQASFITGVLLPVDGGLSSSIQGTSSRVQ